MAVMSKTRFSGRTGHIRRRREVCAQGGGFTLVEVMLSLAMVTLLLVGVNMVFQMTSDTVGIGQAAAEVGRNNRAARAVMEDDARHWAPDAPLFIIHNETLRVGPNEVLRRDYMAFPARGFFRRHTANTNAFVSSTTSGEAWIWYGHVMEFDRANQLVPEAQSNIFGRAAILLKSPAALPPGEEFLPRTTWPTPLGAGIIQRARMDLAGTTLEELRSDVMLNRVRLNTGAPVANWWRPFVYRFECRPNIPKPLTGDGMALASTYFLGGCRECIIEFAGDYLTQDNNAGALTYGNVIRIEPDGILDFIVTRPMPTAPVRGVRWYGLDRDTNGDRLPDVQPIGVLPRAVAQPNVAPIEMEYVNNANGSFYTCVWVNSAPVMVRVSLKLQDPDGKLREGQWVEYVLGQQ